VGLGSELWGTGPRAPGLSCVVATEGVLVVPLVAAGGIPPVALGDTSPEAANSLLSMTGGHWKVPLLMTTGIHTAPFKGVPVRGC